MISFEIFVKSMPPSLSELKVIPSCCFAFKIPDNVTETTVYVPRLENIQFLFLHGENGFVIKGTELVQRLNDSMQIGRDIRKQVDIFQYLKYF